MSQAYDPSSNATAIYPWSVAFLSERDDSSQVPINFVPHAGIYLTPACFGDGVYEDDAAQLCVSNLIASQIRRFVVDIYWDPNSHVFSLCPVSVPDVATSLNKRSSIPIPELYPGSMQGLIPRQAAEALTTTTIRFQQSASFTTASGTVLHQLGQYQCSSTLDIDTIVDVFESYYVQSANTLDARLQILIFNLHVANSSATVGSTTSKLLPAQLPLRNETLGSHFRDIDEYLYGPSQLAEERSNLNGSWFQGSTIEYFPISQYFTVQELPNGQISTPDGWPNEVYIQFDQSRRTLVGYGSIDSALGDYDFGLDANIFPPGVLHSDVQASINATGGISSGCFYNASELNVQQVKNSWAVSSLSVTDPVILGNAADNYTSCGIAPILNTTFSDTAANDNPGPYQSFGNQALFSWAVGQPKNDSDFGNGLNVDEYRCAVIISDSATRGHWVVANCLQEYYIACRQNNQPYRWTVSQSRGSFAQAHELCGINATFDVPRTGLENTYLYQRILSEAARRNDSSMVNATWINFNSQDLESCWVTTGINGTCPYRRDEQAIRQRQILVPSIAAFIVLLLTMLTMLVKCNANRRNSRIRKRGEGGWDYEGIPS